MAREEVGCCLCGAGFGGLREKLVVLGFEEGTDGGEVIGGDGVEERAGHDFNSGGKWLDEK